MARRVSIVLFVGMAMFAQAKAAAAESSLQPPKCAISAPPMISAAGPESASLSPVRSLALVVLGAGLTALAAQIKVPLQGAAPFLVGDAIKVATATTILALVKK